MFNDFKGLKNLDSLILAHNQLTSVPANVFRHLTLLSSLELEGNNIAYVDKDAFAGLEGTKFIIYTNKDFSFEFDIRQSRE